MASPFYLFRKYQRAFIAIAAVVAMFIFVVADPLMTWLQQSGGGGTQQNANTVVATWDGGEINLQQLQLLTQRRVKISEFLGGLIRNAAMIVEEEGGTPEPPALPNFIIQDASYQQIQIDSISKHVMADLAKESDISVSDKFINHYLREWGLRRMGDVEISSLLQRANLTEKTLFAGLRELLMAHFYFSSYTQATAGIMPAERWEDWKHVNERISLEAAILPANNFLASVPDPSETELKQFYELHKEREPDTRHRVVGTVLPAPDPGFRDPRRVRVQYLVGNLDDWALRMAEQVTEDEIAEYYESNKRIQFVDTSTTQKTKPAEKPKPISAEGLFDEEPNSETTSEEATAPLDADSNSAEAEESQTEEAAAEEAPADDESGNLPRKSPFRLAALQTEATTGEADEETAPASDDSPASDEADAATDTASDSAETADEDSLRFVPLSEVRNQIRNLLAREKAQSEMQQAVAKIYTKLQATYNPYGYKVVSARTEETEIPAPPAILTDYKSLATEAGLISEETVLLSRRELFETQVGRAVDVQSQTQSVVQGMFDEHQLYQPFRAIDAAGDAYIVCKIEDVPSDVPAYDDVSDNVLAAWKRQEAAKLALAKAEEIAKAADESGQTVAAAARDGGYEVVTTDMFSWLTFGTTQAEIQRGYRLNQAPPLESVGNDFMSKVFELKSNEKAALLNYDQTNAYLVQIKNRERTQDELHQQFLNDSVYGWYGGRAMNYVRSLTAQRQLETKLTEEIGLDLDKLREFFGRDKQ